jgi:2-polyprenyl-6-methoxyphenol hydroxylase-like FAD-dependent oxidoreductase
MSHEHTTADHSAPHALVAGASFAGLSTAFWLHQLGYRVTIVETAGSLRKGGTPVDIKDGTIEVAERMGILDDIILHSLPPRPTQFMAPDGTMLAVQSPDAHGKDDSDRGFEITRDDLLDILFRQIAGKVEIIFNNAITSLHDDGAAVHVTLAHGPARDFSLVVGCDGNHSALRQMHFGPEAQYSHYLGLYFSISIIDTLVVAPNTTQIFSLPGRTVMLNSYESKTDVVCCFHAAQEIPYDYRDVAQQRRIVQERLAGMGWLVPALLDQVSQADNFYFDKMAQVKMPAWTKGRIALVGDAAYCASPAAGMGGSLAIVGAAALADALRDHPHDLAAAFTQYHDRLAPLIDEVQAGAVAFGLDMFVPRTEEALQARNAQLAQESVGAP